MPIKVSRLRYREFILLSKKHSLSIDREVYEVEFVLLLFKMVLLFNKASFLFIKGGLINTSKMVLLESIYAILFQMLEIMIERKLQKHRMSSKVDFQMVLLFE